MNKYKWISTNLFDVIQYFRLNIDQTTEAKSLFPEHFYHSPTIIFVHIHLPCL